MIFGAVLDGIHAVQVHVSVAPGPFDVVGLSEPATRETRVRVRASFSSLGKQPSGIVTVARVDGVPIGPGAALDLAIAVAASGLPVPADVLFAGELSLMGEIRPVRGQVPIALLVRGLRIQAVIPAATLPVPADMLGTRLLATHLREVFEAIEIANLPSEGGTGEWLLPLPTIGVPTYELPEPPAWSDVANIPAAAKVREAVEGGAKVLVLVGPAGSGRTMISRRIASLLPALTEEERLDVATIQSAAGLPTHGSRPFRAPHHTASTVAIVGGGSPIRPGEATLAHLGVLLVDEANEMPRASIDGLISALRRGKTQVGRMAASVPGGVHVTTLPARPAVTVISIALPTPRDTSSRKDVPLTTREQASLDALTKRYLDLADRFKGELGATVIEMPRIDVKAMAKTGAVS